MDKTKILIAIVVALLVLNSATLVFLWLQHPPRATIGPRQPRDPGAVLSQELGFTQQQQQQFDVLREAHHARMVVLGDSLKHLKDSLYTLLLSRDSIQAKALCTAIGGVQQQIEQVTYDHFRQVRSLLTPEQRQKYDPMLRNAIAGTPRPARDERDQPEPAGTRQAPFGRSPREDQGQRSQAPPAKAGR
ncbi:MAG TPA: hypothetical protein VMF29_07065 [Candidatus Edwardsbacteria bacterium]|nr:hypothetical protein [Candidatus Edwardsbacteria bacterium]